MTARRFFGGLFITLLIELFSKSLQGSGRFPENLSLHQSVHAEDFKALSLALELDGIPQ